MFRASLAKETVVKLGCALCPLSMMRVRSDCLWKAAMIVLPVLRREACAWSVATTSRRVLCGGTPHPSRRLRETSRVFRNPQCVGRMMASMDASPTGEVEMFDFENVPDRREIFGAIKWDKYGGKDVIPMWVADMEFPVAPVISKAIRDRLDNGVFGYTSPTPGVKDAVVRYLQERHNVANVDQSWLFFTPGTVQSLNAASSMIPEGSAVMVFTPRNREVITLDLDKVNGCWTFDWDGMDKAVKDHPNLRLLMLCNPHNPVGRVFSEDELRRLGQFCELHDILIVADEIHCDLILDKDVEHTCMLSVDGGRFADRTILLNAPSKTYNAPGLGCSYAVIPSKEIRLAFTNACRGWVTQNTSLGYTACEAAYKSGGPWLKALIEHLRGNREALYHFVEARLPEVKIDPMQATYLAWLDVKELGWKSPGLEFERAGVGITDGKTFLGEGFVRINFGCPRSMLMEGLLRMERAIVEGYRNKKSD